MIQSKTIDGETIRIPLTYRNYKFIRPIGPCQNGVVIEAIHKQSGQIFACKVLLKKYYTNESSARMRSLERETRIQSTLNHPNIVRCHETLYTDDYFILVLDYCRYGDLISYMKNFRHMTIIRKLTIMRQILDAIIYLHSKGIVHRDIKLENIFINENHQAMLGDFGCCEVISENKKGIYDTRGTLCYASPECLKGKIKDPRMSDVWSYGITFFSFLTDHLPWSSPDGDQMKQEILSGNEIGLPENMPNDCCDLIWSATEFEQEKRATAEKLRKLPVFQYIEEDFDNFKSSSSTNSESKFQDQTYSTRCIFKKNKLVIQPKINMECYFGASQRSIHRQSILKMHAKK
ncbi:CAMK family protein kinase [Tritrichomonas foetus]|uniref:CAMK family protein kinase n=1 Tax=Tritrichomonas foetus TaxID=1144522 RepID=A0A1J4K8S9_9EUKA|nr:CAMK family protein kinase [Tritrichomonas foetus]|eukprot:OHT05845.1 CAMK family protein kinase [Tritrichomonas foetus]